MEKQILKDQKDFSFYFFKGMPLQNKKAALILSILFVFIALLMGTISFIPVYSNLAFLLIKGCQLLAFLIAGIVYLLLLYRYVFTLEVNIGGSWLYTLLLSLIIAGILLILYFINNSLSSMMALGSSSAFLLPFIITQAWYFYRNIEEEEVGVGPIKVGGQEIIELQEVIKKNDYETRFRQEQEEFKLKQKQVSQTELRQELEEMRRKQKEASESKLKQEQEEIRQKEKEAYENKLNREQEEIRRKEKEAYENKLNKELEKMSLKQQETYENKLKQEQEEIRQKEKEAYENKLNKELEKMNLKQQETYENKLKQEQEGIRQKEKEAYENKLRQELEKMSLKQQEAYENKLKQEQEKMSRKEKESFEIQLRKEQEEAMKRKSIHDKQEKIRETPIFIEEINDKEIKEKELVPDKTEQSEIKPDKSTYDTNEKDKIWFYTEASIEQSPVIFLNSIPLYIQLSVKSSAIREDDFPALAPLEMKLGDFFNHFLDTKMKNKKLDIDLVDDEQKSYGWKFYAKGGMLLKKRELNPTLSLRKNKIKEMAVIIARRM